MKLTTIKVQLQSGETQTLLTDPTRPLSMVFGFPGESDRFHELYAMWCTYRYQTSRVRELHNDAQSLKDLILDAPQKILDYLDDEGPTSAEDLAWHCCEDFGALCEDTIAALVSRGEIVAEGGIYRLASEGRA